MRLTTHPWRGRSHAELAELVRELLLAGHLIDRSGMPHALARFGADGMRDIAIDEWMAASPIYTRRMQRLLGFEGTTVATIFKGMQLDIGAPPEFMDFRYEVTDDRAGAFHVAHCGALMDVEPMGDDFVVAMCHHIEDPTFDATATATNERARMRPLHRPPRLHHGSEPHCAWTVSIDDATTPLAEPAVTRRLARSHAASLVLDTDAADLATDDGNADYAGPLDPDLVMESFSSATLAAIGDEVALQGQLLARAYLLAVSERADAAEAVALGLAQAAGVAGVVTRRLAAALGAPADLVGLADVLCVHPLLLPRTYIDLDLAVLADPVTTEHPTPSLLVTITGGAGFDEPDGLCWPALLTGPTGDEILRAAVVCHLPTATIRRVDPGGAIARWIVTDATDVDGTPVALPGTVALTALSTGADFAFARRTRGEAGV